MSIGKRLLYLLTWIPIIQKFPEDEILISLRRVFLLRALICASNPHDTPGSDHRRRCADDLARYHGWDAAKTSSMEALARCSSARADLALIPVLTRRGRRC